MRITSMDWKYRNFLSLGVQTNPGLVTRTAHWKAVRWAPRRAVSYTLKITHTDYDGRAAEAETGYASVAVSYFTTRTEGDTLIVDRDPPFPLTPEENECQLV